MGSRRAAVGGAWSGRVGSRSRPARHTGLPLRSRPGAGRRSAPTPVRHRQRRARSERRLGDEYQAVTIAEVVDLIEVGTAIDARRRSAPPATEALHRYPRERSPRVEASR
jgi:hypothetical protein